MYKFSNQFFYSFHFTSCNIFWTALCFSCLAGSRRFSNGYLFVKWPIICSMPQEGMEKLDLGEECDRVIPRDDVTPWLCVMRKWSWGWCECTSTLLPPLLSIALHLQLHLSFPNTPAVTACLLEHNLYKLMQLYKSFTGCSKQVVKTYLTWAP